MFPLFYLVLPGICVGGQGCLFLAAFWGKTRVTQPLLAPLLFFLFHVIYFAGGYI